MGEYKKKVIQEEGLTEEHLNRLIKKKLSLPGISGEKMALLAILQELGIDNEEIIEGIREELIPPASLKKIGDLNEGMRCTSLVAKICRILPEREGKNRRYQTFILLDETGEVPLTFFGKTLSKVKEKHLTLGGPLLIKCVNVRKLGKGLSLIAGEETRIRKIDEEKDQTKNLPPLNPILSIRELLDKFESIEIDESKEVNCRGVLVWKGEVREFERNDGSTGKVMHLRITGATSESSIRGVAWGRAIKLVNNFDLGDIIQVRGGKVKISSYHLDQVSNRREALEIHIGNLTNIKREGRDSLKIQQANEDMRGKLFYFYALETPQMRKYKKNGETKKMLFLKVGDDTGVARLVVWKEDLIDKLENIGEKTRLKSFGNVKQGEYFDIEIHVSGTGNVTKDPSDFPERLDWADVTGSREESKKRSSKKHIGAVTDFSELHWDAKCDLEGLLAYKEIEDQKKKEGMIIIGDGKNRIKGIVQNSEILEKLKQIPENSKIRITNAVTPERRKEYDLKRINIRSESSVELLMTPTKEKVNESSKLKEKRQREIFPPLLREIQEEGSTEILVTVNLVKEVEMKDFCEVCGGVIVSDQGKTKICEKGHETGGRPLLSLVLDIDDGNTRGSAIFKGDKIQEVGSNDQTKADILSNKQNFIKEINEEIVGRDFLLKGSLRFEEGEKRIYVDKFESISPSNLTEMILKKISRLQSRES